MTLEKDPAEILDQLILIRNGHRCSRANVDKGPGLAGHIGRAQRFLTAITHNQVHRISSSLRRWLPAYSVFVFVFIFQETVDVAALTPRWLDAVGLVIGNRRRSERKRQPERPRDGLAGSWREQAVASRWRWRGYRHQSRLASSLQSSAHFSELLRSPDQ
jgi:hypothetical protein